MGMGRGGSLVGRERELAVLSAAADRARSGEPAVVVVEGEPGIGKTRLVAELARQLPDTDAVMVRGYAVQLAGGALPYGVIAGLVRGLRARLGEDPIRAVLGDRVAALGSLDSSWGTPDERGDRQPVFEAVHRLVWGLAQGQLVCLVVEDLHWSDASSLDLLTVLTGTGASGRLLIVATTRPEGSHRLNRIVAQGELLNLHPLPDDAIRELVTATSVDPPDEDEFDQIIALAEGIPLYVEELVAMRSASTLPPALAVGFTARLAGLSAAARQLLEAVAVAEGEVPAELLRRVLRAKRSSAAEALDQLRSLGLVDVVGDGRVQVHHELLRRAVIDALSPLIRSEWHRRWALAFDRVGPTSDPTVLAAAAHHWFHAGDPDQAVPAAVRAARAASAAGAATEAAIHWHRALMHWHRARDAAGSVGDSHEAALVEGTTVMRLTGAYREVLEVLTQEGARTSTDWVKRLWHDLWLASLAGRLGDPRGLVVPREGVIEVLDQLAAEPPGPLVRATLFMLLWDARDAGPGVVEPILDLIEDQVSPVTTPGDFLALRVRRARFMVSHGDADRALMLLRDGLNQAGRVDPTIRGVAAALEVWYLLILGRLDESIRVGERLLDRLGSPLIAGANWASTADNLACAHEMVGSPARAEELMNTILDSTRDDASHALTACDLVGLLLNQGRTPEAAAVLDRIANIELPTRGSAGFMLGQVSQVAAARARLAQARGDLTTARALLEPVLADADVPIESEYLWSIVLQAGRLFDGPPGLEPMSTRQEWAAAVRSAAARIHRYGALGDAWSADVEAHLDRALEQDSIEQWIAVTEAWERLGAQAEHALTRMRLAESLALAHQPERATAELSRALEIADRLGAKPLAENIRATARRHRLRVDRAERQRDDTHGLTTRELEVLSHLAEGRTNDQIAASLFMSPKTASVHVSRIITKLGVTNRTEAAAFAHRTGLA